MASNQVERLAAIEAALSDASQGDFAEVGAALLKVFGYSSERTIPDQDGKLDTFLKQFPRLGFNGEPVSPDTLPTQDEAKLREHARSIHILFQYTDDDIPKQVAQGSFLADETFAYGHQRSFLFVSAELDEESYNRGHYASFTREINRRFPGIPAVVLFRTSNGQITLAFVHRRANKRDENRDVLGTVSLIREIDPVKTHRAHLDILRELSLVERLKWIDDHRDQRNFDGLLRAWLDALDTEELNRRFYRELKTWFDRAIEEAKFPAGVPKEQPAERHAIRLITRLLFVWFIKEKGLVQEDLFVEAQVSEMLRDYDKERGDSYYRAILQNLFFATLNTPIEERGFREQGNRKGYNDQHRVFSRYRFETEIEDPERLLRLFSETPFINGGLFDCLDSLDARGSGAYRIDYFSDNVIDPGRKDHEFGALSIPNRLLFDDKGLISIFNHYRFTVEENTPVDQEVALDPELLGKAFENLLASVNPETGKNARKQSGSYYTPRTVVDYMVDEALVAALMERIDPPEPDKSWWEDILRYLLDYSDAGELFDDEQKRRVIRAIAELRVLDPAVGSGAFPMGILHKLTLALRRLDPDNSLWQDTQREFATERADAAFWIPLKKERDEELDQISDTFERYGDSDFGRKLYLIQRCIFGVDNDPNATEIAKLRFFISLAIEQEPNDDPSDNFAIRPLPNLETRFVTADSLKGLERPAQLPLGEQADAIRRIEGQLVANRESYFHAGTRREKQRLKDEDSRLRGILANHLEAAAFPPADAKKIADWQPMEQGVMADSSAAADWFDPEFMFGVRDGFDIVIGNPPYAQVRKGTYSARRFPYSEGKDKGKQNLYKLFVEQSYNLAKDNGTATLIVQSSLMADLSSAATRQLLLDHTQLKHVIEFPKAAPTPDAQLFESVTQGTCIYQFKKSTPSGIAIQISVGNHADSFSHLQFAGITSDTISTLYPSLRCFPHIRGGNVEILKKIASDETIEPLRHYVSSIVQGDLNLTAQSDRFSRHPTAVRLLRGRNIGRFTVKYDTSTEYCDEALMPEKVLENRHGLFLISQEVTGTNDIRRLHFGLAERPPTDYLCGHSTNKTQLRVQEHSRAFLALLNSQFMDWFFRMTSTNNHVSGYELEQLPIPSMDSNHREELTGLVDSILKEKDEDPNADVSELESQIDALVYGLYGLTDEEVSAIEGQQKWPKSIHRRSTTS